MLSEFWMMAFIVTKWQHHCRRTLRAFSTAKEIEFDILTVDKFGKKEPQKISMKSLKTQTLGFHARDVIALGISPHASDNNSQQLRKTMDNVILPRESATVASLGNIKVILKQDTLVVFNPLNPLVKSWVQHISKELKDLAHVDDDFELFILENLLNEMCDSFDRRLALYDSLFERLMEKGILTVADRSESVLSHSLLYKIIFEEYATMDRDNEGYFYKLAPMLDLCYDFELELKNAQKCLVDIVSNRDDIAKLSIHVLERTRKRMNAAIFAPKNADQTTYSEHLHEDNDAEIMLESYILRITSSLRGVMQLQQRVKSQQTLADMSLKLKRNRLMWLNVNMSAGSVCIGFCSGVYAAFGMNLSSGLEEQALLFYGLSGVTVAVSGLMYYRLLKYMRGDFSMSVERKQVEERNVLESIFADINVVDIIIGKYLHEKHYQLGRENAPLPISKGSFARLLAEVKGVAQVDHQEVTALFSLIDKNMDGIISEKEAEKSME